MEPTPEPSREIGIPDPPVTGGMVPNRTEMEDSEPSLSNRAEMEISEPSVPNVASTPFRPNLDQARAFLKEVKNTFKEDKDKADQFLQLMKDVYAGKIDLIEVRPRVKDLFGGQWALIVGFNAFLPPDQHITVPKESVKYSGLINYMNKIRLRFQSDELVFNTFCEILSVYRKGNKSKTEMHRDVAHLFKAQHADDLLEEFVDLSGSNFASPVEMKQVAKYYTEGEERVGDGVNNNGMPSSNLEKDERKRIKSASRVDAKTGKFQVGQFSLVGEIPVELKQAAKHYTTEERVKDEDQDNGMPSSNLEKKQRKMMEKKKKDSSELDEMQKATKAGDEEKEKDLAYLQRRLCQKPEPPEQVDRLIQEQTSKQCQAEEQNESSREPLCTSSSKPPDRVDVSNSWKSVKRRKRGFSFKKKTECEENLLRCEDDQFELDVVIERMADTIKKVSKLADSINGSPELELQMPTFVLEHHLSAINLRCIKSVYGDRGLKCIELLKKSPAKALPVILIRLRQKYDEWCLCRSETNNVWAHVRAELHLQKKHWEDQLKARS